MKKYFFLLLLIGCTTPKQQQPDPLQTVKNFIIWYGTNYQEANSFGLVNQGDSAFYSVNFEETEKYLAYLKSSGFVSDEFLSGFRKKFSEAQINFEKDPMNEGPPLGFDYDIVLHTQEPDLVIEKAKNPTIIFSSIRDNEATISLDVEMKLEFKLTLIDGNWKINRIDPTE
ncbi:MAG TPA: hypothetical protein VFU05_20265 [Cyclobacteriaceae bacterium]|nr:hypothetical protein [Cyclobacteriaceae bacterium]